MFTFVWSFSFKNYLSTSNFLKHATHSNERENLAIWQLSLTVKIYYFLDSSWFLMVKFLNTICYEKWNFVVFFWPAILILGVQSWSICREQMMFPNTLALIQEFSYWLLNRLRVLRLCSAHNILLYSCSFQMVSQRFCTHKHVTGLLQCVVFNFHFSVNEPHSPSISHSVCQAINQTRNQIN